MLDPYIVARTLLTMLERLQEARQREQIDLLGGDSYQVLKGELVQDVHVRLLMKGPHLRSPSWEAQGSYATRSTKP